MKLTVGLEIHVELKTATKMFCSSANDPEASRPNLNICPICLGHPGTLPTINQAAVWQVLRVGAALGGQLADFTEFDRKNYFYPDIPKGYQISQYQYPLVTGGRLAGVDITRIHLEEDTARLQHDSATGAGLVDFNRAGVPLMELVTEPVITSAGQAVDFARQLRLLLSPAYLDVSGANLEKGQMRIEANISVSDTADKLGTKVEVKNLNSFKAVEKAIDYEYHRQIAILKKNDSTADQIKQETMGWDEAREVTFSQRQKEQSHDYRYFPDPDLPKLYLSEWPAVAELKNHLPELPWVKYKRLIETYGLKAADIEILIQEPVRADFFEAVAQELNDRDKYQTAANILIGEVFSRLGSQEFSDIFPTADRIGQLSPVDLARLTELFADQIISSRGVKEIVPVLILTGGRPEAVARDQGLVQQSDRASLAGVVDQVMVANTEAVAEYQAGKESILQFLVGQGMKLSGGSANPQVLAELLKQALKK